MRIRIQAHLIILHRQLPQLTHKTRRAILPGPLRHPIVTLRRNKTKKLRKSETDEEKERAKRAEEQNKKEEEEFQKALEESSRLAEEEKQSARERERQHYVAQLEPEPMYKKDCVTVAFLASLSVLQESDRGGNSILMLVPTSSLPFYMAARNCKTSLSGRSVRCWAERKSKRISHYGTWNSYLVEWWLFGMKDLG